MTIDPLELLARKAAPEPEEDEMAKLRRQVALVGLKQELIIEVLLYGSLPHGLRERLRALEESVG